MQIGANNYIMNVYIQGFDNIYYNLHAIIL